MHLGVRPLRLTRRSILSRRCSWYLQRLVSWPATGAWQCNWSRVGAILCDTDGKFGDAIEDKAAATTIKVIELFGEMGGDFLQLRVSAVVHVIHWRGEVGGNSLLSFGHVTNQNGVYTNLYLYRSTTRKPLAKFSNFVNVFSSKND